MLQLRYFRGDGVVPTLSQTRRGIVVVKRQDELGVVETLDGVTRFGVVPGSIHVLEDMHVLRNVIEEAMFLYHGVQEVDVACVEGGSRNRVLLESLFDNNFHQSSPRRMVLWDDNLIYI